MRHNNDLFSTPMLNVCPISHTIFPKGIVTLLGCVMLGRGLKVVVQRHTRHICGKAQWTANSLWQLAICGKMSRPRNSLEHYA